MSTKAGQLHQTYCFVSNFRNPKSRLPNVKQIAPNQIGTAESRLEVLLLIACAVGAASVVGLCLYFSRYGLDLTDESFYLIGASNPGAYGVNIPASLFGFVYHPLYVLLGGDVAAMRQANIIGTATLAWILCFILLRNLWAGRRVCLWHLAIVAAALSTLSLVSFGPWLVTPNYNTLAFQALLLTMIGLLLLREDGRYDPVSSWILLGVGGWLAFMAKPSTAIAVAVLVLSYFIVSRQKRWFSLALAGAHSVCLIILSAYLIDGSIGAFLSRMDTSVQLLRVLGSGQELAKIFRIDSFDLTSSEIAIAVVASTLIALTALAFMQERQSIRVTSALVCMLIACVTVFLCLSGYVVWPVRRVVLFATLFTFLSILLIIFRNRIVNRLSRRHYLLAALFLFLPHVYSFGTNGNYWSHGSAAGLFWVLSGVVLVSPVIRLSRGVIALIPLALVFQFMVVSMVNGVLENPYRQPHSLRENTSTLNLRGQGHLVLSRGFHDYLSEAMATARDGGFRPGMAAVDLTGQSPGILYALGARSLGQPWMVGGYPGSTRLAIAVLNMVECKDIAAAWLLEEPKGPRRLSTEAVLSTFGAELSDDYEVVGLFSTAAYAGGYRYARMQKLLRPTRTTAEAESACIKAREHAALRGVD